MSISTDLVWIAAEQTFRLTISEPEPTLELPDGRSVTLGLTAWLALAEAVRELAPDEGRARRPGPPNRGKAWEPEEEERLAAAYAGGEDPNDIAVELGRTRGAVLARLVRIGLLDEAAVALRYSAGPAPVRSSPAST